MFLVLKDSALKPELTFSDNMGSLLLICVASDFTACSSEVISSFAGINTPFLSAFVGKPKAFHLLLQKNLPASRKIDSSSIFLIAIESDPPSILSI